VVKIMQIVKLHQRYLVILNPKMISKLQQTKISNRSNQMLIFRRSNQPRTLLMSSSRFKPIQSLMNPPVKSRCQSFKRSTTRIMNPLLKIRPKSKFKSQMKSQKLKFRM